MKVDASLLNQLPTAALNNVEKAQPKQQAQVAQQVSDKVTISNEASELLRQSMEVDPDVGVETLMNGGGTEPPPPPPDLDGEKKKT